VKHSTERQRPHGQDTVGKRPLNPYALRYIAPFASSVISTRAPISPLYSRLARITAGESAGLPQVQSLSAHCLCRRRALSAGGLFVHGGSPLIVASQPSYLLVRVYLCRRSLPRRRISSFHSFCAFTTVDRMHMYSP
jgi:hypothetical protein